MEKVTSKEMLGGNIYKGLITMAVPLMFINLFNTCYSLVDTYWVNKIGELHVAAVSLVSPISQCGNAFAIGLSAAGIALMSKALGSGDKERANHIATILVKLCLVLGFGFMALGFIFPDTILKLIGTTEGIYHDTYMYLMGLVPDFTFIFLISIFQAIRQADGDSKTGVKINVIASILNMILDPLLIFGLNWSLLGAALATTFSKMLVAPIIMYILITDKQSVHIDLKKYRFEGDLFKEIVVVALPSSFGSLLSDFGFIMMHRYIISYGEIVLSAYGIGSKISNLFYIPLNCIGTALTPFVGQNIGAKNYKRAHECFWDAMKIVVGLSLAVMVLGMIGIRPFGRWYASNASDYLLDLACEYAFYSVNSALFMGWMGCITSIFNGSGNTRTTFIIQVIRLWGFRIPMIHFFSRYTTIGHVGIWYSMILSNLFICIVGQILYYVVFCKKYPAKTNEFVKEA